MPRIVIVGGGISGLALAYRLERRLPRAAVILLEREQRVGGTIGTIARDGFRIEAGPNGFLDNNPATLQLCRQLQIDHGLITASEAARKNRYLLLGGQLRGLPSGPASFLLSKVLSWRAKKNILMERFRPPCHASQESIDAFARRRVGDEVADTLVDPFVTGIFAGDPKRLSIEAALPRIAAYERDHGSVSRGMAAMRRQRRTEAQARGEPPPGPTRMWSYRQGLGFLVEQLSGRLRSAPVVETAARSIRRANGRWLVQGDGGQSWDADVVVLACPTHQQSNIVAELDQRLADEIAGIAYNRVAVVALGYRAADMPKPLDGFGYLTRGQEGRDVLGVQWCSTIFPERAPTGMVLMRAMCGGWRRAEMLDWDDERLVGAVRSEIGQIMGIRVAPVLQHIVRWHKAIPQYHVGHLERVARIDALVRTHAGLFLGGNGYRGIAMNDCVEQAGVLAEKVAGTLSADAV